MAQAIAEGKFKVTGADLRRLIRLEEFLNDEQKEGGTKITVCWADHDGGTEENDSESGTEGG